jgi:predicted RNase H-like HicB family nuclease
MLSSYIAAAMRHAHYEILPEDACFYAEIEGFQGIYATGITLEACREELLEVLEEWILLSVARHLPLPLTPQPASYSTNTPCSPRRPTALTD